MDADDLSTSRQLIRDLISRDEVVREAARQKVCALSPEVQLSLMGCSVREEKTPPSLLRRLYNSIASAGTSSSDMVSELILRYIVIQAIVDDIIDPRFIVPLLDTLAAVSGLSNRDLQIREGRPRWGSGINFPLEPLRLDTSTVLWIKTHLPLRTKIFRALKRTIGNRQAEDTIVLTPARKRAMLRPLNAPYRDVELTELVLDVLKQIGDSEPIPLLERMIAVEAVTDNMKRVQQAAQECVIHLRLRAERGQQAKSLLRASGPGTSDELLRPAAEQADPTPPEELLRSAPSIQ